MKKAFLVLFSFFSLCSFAQSINNYEYVAISKKYDFQRNPDEYQLNSLLKCQLKEYGFHVLYNTDLPLVDENDRCLILNANVISKSNIFLFKFIIEFTDCNNSIILQTQIGGSKEKDLYDAFTEALDGALKTPELVKYKFDGVHKKILLDGTDSMEGVDSEKSKTEESKIETTKEEKSWMEEATPVKVTPKKSVALQNNSVKKKNSTVKSKVVAKSKVNKAVVQTKNIPIKRAQNTLAKVEDKTINEKDKIKENTAVPENAVPEVVKEIPFSEMVLYAQAIEKGFQLVDTTPKVILKIYNTLQPGYYDANIDRKFGAVFIKNNQWVFEYFMEGKLITEPLTIKFCN